MTALIQHNMAERWLNVNRNLELVRPVFVISKILDGRATLTNDENG